MAGTGHVITLGARVAGRSDASPTGLHRFAAAAMNSVRSGVSGRKEWMGSGVSVLADPSGAVPEVFIGVEAGAVELGAGVLFDRLRRCRLGDVCVLVGAVMGTSRSRRNHSTARRRCSMVMPRWWRSRCRIWALMPPSSGEVVRGLPCSRTVKRCPASAARCRMPQAVRVIGRKEWMTIPVSPHHSAAISRIHPLLSAYNPCSSVRLSPRTSRTPERA